jgi:hypothetical protein
MAVLACPTADHERWKKVDAWWRDQRLLGYTREPEGALGWRNCRVCESTLARHEEVMVMDATPDGFWVSATGYAKLAGEMEAGGHLDLAGYFFKRAQDAAVARFDEVCAAAAPELVAVDAVPEQLERTEVLFVPSPWVEREELYDGDRHDAAKHERAEARAER